MGISRPTRYLEWSIITLMNTSNVLRVAVAAVDSCITLLENEREQKIFFNNTLNQLTKDLETLEDSDGR